MFVFWKQFVEFMDSGTVRISLFQIYSKVTHKEL